MKSSVLLLLSVSHACLASDCWYVPVTVARIENRRLSLAADVPCESEIGKVTAIQVKNDDGTYSFGIEILKSECGPLPPITDFHHLPLDPTEGLGLQRFTFHWSEVGGLRTGPQHGLDFSRYVSIRSSGGYPTCDLPQRPIGPCDADPPGIPGCTE